jgi:hypothetical protein
MRAGIEPVVQMRCGIRDCVGPRHAERIETFRSRAFSESLLKRLQI